MRRISILFITVTYFAAMFVANSSGASKEDEYELQQKCSNSASEIFQKEYVKGYWNDTDNNSCFTKFTNHYHGNINKCIMDVQSTCKSREYYYKIDMWDIYDNKEIGLYFKVGETLLECYVNDDFCASEHEWAVLHNNLISK